MECQVMLCVQVQNKGKILRIQLLCNRFPPSNYTNILSHPVIACLTASSHLYVLPGRASSIVQSSNNDTNASQIGRGGNRRIARVDLVNALIATGAGNEAERIPSQLARSTGLALGCVREARNGGSLWDGS
jgi:hypothetical protein